MKFYKGDIIYERKDNRGNPHDSLWAINLFGVLVDAECDGKFLFYRPFRNKIKHFFRNILK